MIRKSSGIKPTQDTTSEQNSGLCALEGGNITQMSDNENNGEMPIVQFSINNDDPSSSSSFIFIGDNKSSLKSQEGVKDKNQFIIEKIPSEFYDEVKKIVKTWADLLENDKQAENDFWKKKTYKRRELQVSKLKKELKNLKILAIVAETSYSDHWLVNLCYRLVNDEPFTIFYRGFINELDKLLSRVKHYTIQYLPEPKQDLSHYLNVKNNTRIKNNLITEIDQLENPSEIKLLKEENRNFAFQYSRLQKEYFELKWETGKLALAIMEEDNMQIHKGSLYLRVVKGKMFYSVIAPDEKVIRDILIDKIDPPKEFTLENLKLLKKQLLSAVNSKHINQYLTTHDFTEKLKEQEEAVAQKVFLHLQKQYGNKLSEKDVVLLSADIDVSTLQNTINQQTIALKTKNKEIKKLQQTQLETFNILRDMQTEIKELKKKSNAPQCNNFPQNQTYQPSAPISYDDSHYDDSQPYSSTESEELSSSNISNDNSVPERHNYDQRNMQIGPNFFPTKILPNTIQVMYSGDTKYSRSAPINRKNEHNKMPTKQLGLKTRDVRINNNETTQLKISKNELLDNLATEANEIKKKADNEYFMARSLFKSKKGTNTDVIYKFGWAKNHYNEYKKFNTECETTKKRIQNIQKNGKYSVDKINQNFGC